MSRIVLEGLRKSFGNVEVIPNLDLEVRDGEFVALVGPSGCGKSTILRMIAGLEDPTSGSIIMDQGRVNDASPKERNVAMVFQNYALYPHMTVRQNMGLNLKVAGLSRAEVSRRVDDAAKLLGVDALLDRRPGQLSGGQRQRVAMGRAIVRNPAVFLFDEPLSNLDAALRVQMRGEIKSLHEKVRTTSIYVTHDQIEAMTLADRVVVLKSGSIEQQGRPIELYDDPHNIFVARFIGSPGMNIMEAVIERRDGGVVARMTDAAALALPGGAARHAGRTVDIGIRPEHLSLAGAGAGAGGDLPARVRYSEPTGAQTLIMLDLGQQQISALLQGSAEVSPGQDVVLSVEPGRTYAFSKEDGSRIAMEPA